MRVAVTGTPGTGKTSATETVERNATEAGERESPSSQEIEVIHLNDHVETDRLYTGVDEARESRIADLDRIGTWLDEREHGGTEKDEGKGKTGTETTEGETLVVESHLAHLLPADRVVVLRCSPEELTRRLGERSVGERKARENAESEALDTILSEAVARHGTESVYEIDTTDRTPAEVGREITNVVAGTRAPSAGKVSFLEYFE